MTKMTKQRNMGPITKNHHNNKNKNNNNNKNDRNLTDSGFTNEHGRIDTQSTPSNLLFDDVNFSAANAADNNNNIKKKKDGGSGCIIQFLSNYSVFIGLFIRFFCAWYLPYLMDSTSSPATGTDSNSGNSGSGVMYTDIDYYVYTDAAHYVQNGKSPYQRTTYRYTPFLAVFLAMLPYQRVTSRYVFCLADTLCGYLILLLIRQQQDEQQQDEQEQQQDEQQENQTHREEILMKKKKKDNVLLQKTKNQQQQQQQQKNQQQQEQLIGSLWWLYNPLPINICTRGSAESLIVLLPVLITIYIISYRSKNENHNHTSNDTTSNVKSTTNNITDHRTQIQQQQQSSRSSTKSSSYIVAILAGFTHGIAIHAKLYPIIYTLSYMTSFCCGCCTDDQQNKKNPKVTTTTITNNRGYNMNKNVSSLIIMRLRNILFFLYDWMIRILCTPSSLLFGISTVVTFMGVTYLSVYYYGEIAFQESLLYHFSRVDHRHNYSMHWYWIYLLRGQNEGMSITTTTTMTDDNDNEDPHPYMNQSIISMQLLGQLLVLPQIILLFVSSLTIAPKNLYVALFVQTFVFVTNNKVITAQYFTWYLCLLPLCINRLLYTEQLSTTTITTSNESTKKNNNQSSSNHGTSRKMDYEKVRNILRALGWLLLSILFWLLSAYGLEIQNFAVHEIVWLASVLYYLANVNLLRTLLFSSSISVVK